MVSEWVIFASGVGSLIAGGLFSGSGDFGGLVALGAWWQDR